MLPLDPHARNTLGVGDDYSHAADSFSNWPISLDVVAAAPRERRLLISEAKWGRRKPLSRNLLTNLVQSSQRMPQVIEG